MSSRSIDEAEKRPVSVSEPCVESIFTKIQAVLKTKRDQPFATWYDDNGNYSHQLTFGQVCDRAAVVAHFLRHEWSIKKGERVVLCYGFGLNFLVALLGCLRAGIVPVLVYPPAPPFVKSLEKLNKVKDECNPKLILTDKQIKTAMKMDQNLPFSKSRRMWPTDVEWKVTEGLSQSVARQKGMQEIFSWMGAENEMCCDQDIAFLQYSSGSTGDPKGVMVTFGALMANVKFLHDGFEQMCEKNGGIPDSNVGFSWLPQYHDMGLIVCIISPLLRGCHMHMMAPTTFIKNPLLWLDLMSRHRVGWSVAPDFAFHLVARKFTEARKKKLHPIPNLDLSCVRFLMSSAEPIRPNTKDCFQVLVSEYGLHENWLSACYGLAEHVVGCCWHLGSHLSSSKIKENSDTSEGGATDLSMDSRVAVASRSSIHPSVNLKVVCPDTHVELEDGTVGELWISGPSVAAGYFGKPELTKEVFQAKFVEEDSLREWQKEQELSYLRSGDLAFFQDDYLYICGRIKDLIIVDGVNYYPQDIETVTEASSDAIRPGCVAAFSLDETENDGKLEVVFEIRKRSVQHAQRVCESVQEAILARTGLVPVAVVAIAERTIPKTTSGKIRRRDTRTQLHNGKLEVVYTATAGAHLPSIQHNKFNSTSQTLSTQTFIGSVPETHDSALSSEEKKDSQNLDVILKNVFGFNNLDQMQDVTWDEIGLTSLASVTLVDEIEREFGVSLPVNILDTYQTPGALKTYLKQETILHDGTGNFSVKLPELPCLKGSATTNALIITTLQAVGVLVLLLMLSATIIPAWYFGILVSRHGNDSDLAISLLLRMSIPLIVPVWMLSFSLMVIVVKWTVIGRYTPGVMSMQSVAFVRWWFVDRLVHFWEAWVGAFTKDTPLLCCFYWLLGAKIHLSAKVDAFLREFDLVSIGRDSTVAHAIQCRKFTFAQETTNNDNAVPPPILCFRSITVGENCHVRGMICPGGSLGDNSHVCKLAVVSEGSQVPENVIASGNPARHSGDNDKVEIVGRGSRHGGGVKIGKIIWLFVEAYLIFGLLSVARMLLGNDLLPKSWRYHGIFYYALLIGLTTTLSIAVGLLLHWVLLPCQLKLRLVGEKSSWKRLLEWIVDYHFSLSTRLLLSLCSFSRIWNLVLMLFGLDVDVQSVVHSISFKPSKVDLITIKRSFIAFNMSFDVPFGDPSPKRSVSVMDDAELISAPTSRKSCVQVIDSSLGCQVVVGPGVTLSNVVVPPLTTVRESVDRTHSEDEEDGRKSASPESSDTALPTLWNFCGIELCYILFLAMIILCFVPSYEVWNMTMQHGNGFMAIFFVALILVIQTETWMGLVFLIQLGALGFFGWNQSAVRKRTEPWCLPLYVVYLTACPFLQTKSLVPLLWGTPFFNHLVLCPMGATVHDGVRYFGRVMQDIPLLTFLDHSIVDGADNIAHYQVFGKTTMGPDTIRGILHPGTWTSVNTDMSDSPKTTESGPYRWVLPTPLSSLSFPRKREEEVLQVASA